MIKYLLNKKSFWTQWYIEISNTKFRQRYFVNQQTNILIRTIESSQITQRQYSIQPSVTHKNNMNSTETVTSLQKDSREEGTPRIW